MAACFPALRPQGRSYQGTVCQLVDGVLCSLWRMALEFPLAAIDHYHYQPKSAPRPHHGIAAHGARVPFSVKTPIPISLCRMALEFPLALPVPAEIGSPHHGIAAAAQIG